MSETDPWVVDVDTQNFETTVLQRSLELPVLVDFWAEWCEPCKTLGPLLEQRAREGSGRFLLAKIDIDKYPELAQAFRVEGIPAVMALAGGRLVDGFQGALPEPELDAFLDKVAPAVEGAPQAQADPVTEARALAEAGQPDAALALLEDHLSQAPDAAAARVLACDLLIDLGRLEDAKSHFEALSEGARSSPEGAALQSRIALAEGAGDLEELRAAVSAEPENAEARMALGQGLVAAKDYEGGLQELLEAVRLGDAPHSAEAKAVMLEVFDVLGLEDPVANDYRFKLSLELFA